LPAYVVLPDPHGAQEAGMPMYTQGFLPAVYQPTMFRPGNRPVLNLDLPKGVTTEQRRKTLGLLKQLNQMDMADDDAEFAARLNSYDLAFKMQTEAPAIFDLSNEAQETLDLYGIGKPLTDDYGRRCLLARRLVEKGVRFVCPVSGGGTGNLQWDAHDDIEENHLRMSAQTDQPMAALLTDLKRRGLLDETLVVIGGEFGRSPESQGSKGRDHHNLGFTMVLAGGGIKGGQVYGATDEIGLRAVEKPVHFRDLHTTILHQLGLDQEALSYLHQGREERLTEVLGNVITELV
jgi:membrane-anchored protein YejM (alkaline phosphatase superfamily)